MSQYLNDYRNISNNIIMLGQTSPVKDYYAVSRSIVEFGLGATQSDVEKLNKQPPGVIDPKGNRYTQNTVSYIKDIFQWGSGHDTAAAKSFIDNLVKATLFILDGNEKDLPALRRAIVESKNFNPPSFHPYMDRLIAIFNQIDQSKRLPAFAQRPLGEVGKDLNIEIKIFPPAPPLPLNKLETRFNDMQLAWLCNYYFKWGSGHNTPAAKTFMDQLFKASLALLEGDKGRANRELNAARANISCCQPPQVADYARFMVLSVQNWINIGYIPRTVTRPHGELFPATQSNITFTKPLNITLPAPVQTGTGVLTPKVEDYLNDVFVWTPTGDRRRDRKANFALRLMIEASRATLAGNQTLANKYWNILNKYSKPYWGAWDSCGAVPGSDKFLVDYLSGMYEVARWIHDEKELPDEIRVPRSMWNLDEFITKLSPAIGTIEETSEGGVAVLYSSEDVEISDPGAALIESVGKIPPEVYAASRKEEIALVKKELKEGKLKDKKPEELAKEALKARADLAKTKQDKDKEVLETQGKVESKKVEYKKKQQEFEIKRQKLAKEIAEEEKKLGPSPAAAITTAQINPIQQAPAAAPQALGYMKYSFSTESLSQFIGLSGVLDYDPDLNNPEFANLDGIFDKIGKEVKRAYDRVRKSIKRGFKSVGDEVKRSIKRIGKNELAAIGVGVLTFGVGVLPLAAVYLTSFGKRITKEVKRIERRTRKELVRFSAKVVKVAPIIKALAPFLGFIPIIGQILVVLVVLSVSSIEIFYAYKMKRALEKASKNALRALQAELEALEAKLARMQGLINRLEALRKKIAALARLEQKKRKELIAKIFETEEEKSRKILLSGLLGASSLIPFVLFKKPGLLSYAYLAAVGGTSIYIMRDTRNVPDEIIKYDECTQFAPEELCRQQYLQESLKRSLPKLAEVPKLQQEVLQVMNELQGLTQEPV